MASINVSQSVFREFNRYAGHECIIQGCGYNPYFFLDRELNMIVNTHQDYDNLKSSGQIRHAKIMNKGVLYDYVANKSFDSFEAWLADIGPSFSLANIRFGVNRHNFNSTRSSFDRKSISFSDLMRRLRLEIVKPPPVEDVLGRLEKNNLNHEHLWVRFGSMFVTWERFKTISIA
jgi:hypothetical protein